MALIGTALHSLDDQLYGFSRANFTFCRPARENLREDIAVLLERVSLGGQLLVHRLFAIESILQVGLRFDRFLPLLIDEIERRDCADDQGDQRGDRGYESSFVLPNVQAPDVAQGRGLGGHGLAR